MCCGKVLPQIKERYRGIIKVSTTSFRIYIFGIGLEIPLERYTRDFENGYTHTKGVTIGFSTPYLLIAVVSLAFAIEYFLKTGNWQGIPEKIFAPV